MAAETTRCIQRFFTVSKEPTKESSTHSSLEESVKLPSTSDPQACSSNQKQCPLCNKYFHKDVINQHANICADTRSEIAYENLISDIADEEWDLELLPARDEEPRNSYEQSSSSSSANLKTVLTELASHIDEEIKENRIDIRRKMAWKDFCAIRRRKVPNFRARFKIIFIGEPAVDTGGPKREFFTGMCNKHQEFYAVTSLCGAILYACTTTKCGSQNVTVPIEIGWFFNYENRPKNLKKFLP